MKLLKGSLQYILLFAIAALAFSQVIGFQHPMVYDMTDCFYPWRFHIGECLQNGVLPFWNPYQDLAYPIHADPSSGAWYPMVWLIGSTLGYSVRTIGLEFFLHVFLAGVGMLHLCKTFRFDPRIAWVAAISYMLCGLFVSNAQHLPYIISAAWLPFLLSHYFRMILQKRLQNGFYAGLFLSFMITGGYPAFVIILFYFFLVTTLFYFIREWKEAKKIPLPFIFRKLLFASTGVVFSLGLLISVIQVSPHLSRLEGFSLEQVLYSHFGPSAFITFITPYAAAHFHEFFDSDISMVNGYFGLAMFVFFLLGIFCKKSVELKLLFALALFSLLAAVGDSLPLRAFLYHYVPGMGVFRFPAVFRIFFMLPAILLAANYLNSLIDGKNIATKRLFIPIISTAFLLLIVLIILRLNGPLGLKAFAKNVVWAEWEHGTIRQHIAFHIVLQILLLACFALVIKLIRTPRIQHVLLATILAFDLILAVQLNGRHTVYYPQITASEAHADTDNLPKGFPLPHSKTLAESAARRSPGRAYWQNYHIFLKEVTADGFNSFSLGNYERLEAEYPFIYKSMQQNSLVFLSDLTGSLYDMKNDNNDSIYVPNKVYLSSSDLKTIPISALKLDSSAAASLVRFSANNFKIATQNTHASVLTIMQKFYPGWKVFIDGKESEIQVSNLNFMSVSLEKGDHNVEFRYSNPSLKWIYILQFILVPITLLAALLSIFRYKVA